jgi:hypothetical protein
MTTVIILAGSWSVLGLVLGLVCEVRLRPAWRRRLSRLIHYRGNRNDEDLPF